MEYYETQEYKQEQVDRLASIDISKYMLANLDARLEEYVRGVQDNPDAHNVDEILAVIKFFRLKDTYYFANEPVWDVMQLLEKILRFSTQDGMQCLQLSPCQVFQLASIYGFYREWLNPKTNKNEMRRLVKHAILFVPRKFGKTTMVIGSAVNDFLFGEANAQAYVAANTDRQALICFKEIRNTLEDADTDKDLKFTAHSVRWSKKAFKNATNKRTSFIESLSGNPKTKDGLNASTCIYDEFGSAFYVKDHSDGASLLQVIESSMGQRREPLTLIITTASRVIDSPFQIMLEGAKKALRGEAEADWQFAHLFHPDYFEMEDEFISNPYVWAKCQPHLGITVQPDYYAEYYAKAQLDPEAYVEFKTKLLNIFQRVNHQDWLNSLDIHKRTGHRKIDDLRIEDGWECYGSMDFSKGNDLNAQVYLCHRIFTDDNGQDKEEFFFDCDAWITEEQLNKATLNPLYKQWVKDGHMRICKGAVINEMDILARWQEVAEHCNIIMFGYDRFDSKRFINALNAWLWSLGLKPEDMLKSVSQTLANFNAPVQGFEWLVKVEPAKVEFSNNPLFGWCADNCVLEQDPLYENCKPVKRSMNQKIDIIICCLMCISLYDEDDNNKILLN